MMKRNVSKYHRSLKLHPIVGREITLSMHNVFLIFMNPKAG